MSGARYRDLGETIFIRMFRSSPKLRILDIFFDNPYFDFSKSELTRELRMSKQTLYKNFKDLEELEIVEVSRRIGRVVMYRLNRDRPLVRRLDGIITEISPRIAETEKTKMKKPVPAEPGPQ